MLTRRPIRRSDGLSWTGSARPGLCDHRRLEPSQVGGCDRDDVAGLDPALAAHGEGDTGA